MSDTPKEKTLAYIDEALESIHKAKHILTSRGRVVNALTHLRLAQDQIGAVLNEMDLVALALLDMAQSVDESK